MNLMHVPSKKADANNLGRYVDQPCIFNSLRQIKQLSMPPLPQPVQIDWLTVEKEIVERCNLEYQVVGKQLIIVAKHDLHKPKNTLNKYTQTMAVCGRTGLQLNWRNSVLLEGNLRNHPIFKSE